MSNSFSLVKDFITYGTRLKTATLPDIPQKDIIYLLQTVISQPVSYWRLMQVWCTLSPSQSSNQESQLDLQWWGQLRAVLDLPLHPFMALRRISQTVLVMRILSKEETHHSWSSLVMSFASKQSINTRGQCFSLRHCLTINQWYQMVQCPASLGTARRPEETKLCLCLQDQLQFVCWSYCCYNIFQYLRFFARVFFIHSFFSLRMDFQII